MTLLARYAPLFLLLGLWEAASQLGLVSRQMLPPFSEVAVAFAGLIGDGDLLTNGIASLWRALLGFSGGGVVGPLPGAGLGPVRTGGAPLYPVGGVLLSAAQIGAHSAGADLVRPRRCLQGCADLPRLPAAQYSRHL